MQYDHLCMVCSYVEAAIGFMQQMLTVSEDSGEAVLLVESNGENVDPVTVVYSFQNGTGTAQG